MHRVCIEKATGRLLEFQSGGETQEHLDSLKNNALNSGYTADQIEVGWVTDAELLAIKAAQQQLEIDAAPYTEKRKREYPDYRELLDALVKKASSDSDMQKEGAKQEAKYYADCLAVKTKYPKTI